MQCESRPDPATCPDDKARLASNFTPGRGTALIIEADPAADSPKLVRAIGPWSVGANAVNMTIGAGVFALPAVVATQLGDGAVLAYLFCSAAMLLILLCLAEAGSRVASSGGVYAYIETAFGPFVGFVASILFWFGFCIASDAAIANFLIGGVAGFWPTAGAPVVKPLLLLALFATLAIINVRGLRTGNAVVVTLTLLKLVPLIALAIWGLPHAVLPHLRTGDLPSVGKVAQAALVLFFAFVGAETALTPSGEIRDPPRTVPRALMGAIILILLLYLALQFVTQGLLGNALPMSGDAPLAAAGGVLWGPGGRVLLVVCASISVLGTLSGDLLATPRAVYASARDGALPTILAWVHPRYRTPSLAIIVYAGIGYSLSVSGGFEPLAALASASILLVYLGAVLATLKLRRDDVRQAGKPFILAGGPIIPLLAAAIILLVLVNTPWDQLGEVALVAVVSSLWFAFRRARGHIRPVPA